MGALGISTRISVGAIGGFSPRADASTILRVEPA
jgi:hypothetical protein